jgi:hypothetical protein
MAEEIPSPIEFTRISERTTSELEHPREYFEAQVLFASRWSELTGTPYDVALLRNTALYRRIVGSKLKPGEAIDDRWSNLMGKIGPELTASEASELMFGIYKQQAHAIYTPPNYPEDDKKHFGYFSFDHDPKNSANEGKNSIKVHFLNPIRGGIGSLHPSLMSERRESLQNMFVHIQKAHPDATHVMGGSWLYHVPQYRNTFPEAFIRDMKTLVPRGFEENFPESIGNMSFNGDSLWGQFVNRFGEPREKALAPFRADVMRATNPLGLIKAFPHLPLQPMCEINHFYRDLNI